MIFLTIALSVLSAILYRAGGMGKDQEHWMPQWMRHSWIRDWLCPACCLTPIAIVNPSWLLILAYGALGGMLSTYWDWLFGFDNFWFSGFMCGAVGFLMLWMGIPWWVLLIRAVTIALLWGGICAATKNDFVEEYSRGFTLSLSTLLVLCIPH